MLDLNKQTAYKQLDAVELNQTCLACKKCNLAATRTHVVVGSGHIPSDIMIIGEGPGEQEDLSGLPFVGRSGKLLTKLLAEAGINRAEDTFIANIVKCRPPQNRNPLAPEIAACKDYLIRQIQLVKPKIVLLLGAPSLKTILESKLAITKVRGQWVNIKVDYMTNDLQIMPLFHPSYLLRHASKEEGKPTDLTLQDLKRVKARLEEIKIKSEYRTSTTSSL